MIWSTYYDAESTWGKPKAKRYKYLLSRNQDQVNSFIKFVLFKKKITLNVNFFTSQCRYQGDLDIFIHYVGVECKSWYLINCDT